ncbi:hypothetical protein BH09SUM1_BH09SUM1_29000 [soil metagenome]
MKKIAFAAALLAAAGVAHADFKTPTIEGTGITVANYGTALSLQTATPGFGTTLQLGELYVANDATNLYVGIAGNNANNNSGIYIFIDSVTGGATTLEPNTAGGYDVFDDLAATGNGLLPASFTLNTALNIKSTTNATSLGSWDLISNAATYRGDAGTYTGGFNVGVDNSNASSTPFTAGAVSTGIEVQIPRTEIGSPANGATIKIFASSGNFTKGGNAANYMSNQVIPNPGTAGNFGNDGAGGSGGNGLNYNGTGGPNITPASYVMAAPSSVNDWAILE